jgi:hypothetical protein
VQRFAHRDQLGEIWVGASAPATCALRIGRKSPASARSRNARRRCAPPALWASRPCARTRSRARRGRARPSRGRRRSPSIHSCPPTRIENALRQKNLWANFGSGSLPRP